MARYVTVSALCPPPLELPARIDNEARVRRMLEHWRTQLERVLPDKPDLIVVPEVCDRYTGEGASACEWREYYEVRGERVRELFARIAKENHCHITYPAIRAIGDGSWRNSIQLLGRDGRVEGVYDKNHLVVSEGVPGGPIPMRCGGDAPVFDLDIGRAGCAICFDLNFDELRQKYMRSKPELLIFSSMYHGGFMQQAWAYDIRCYFIAAVAGQDARVLSPVGEVLARSTNYFNHVTATINLDCAVCHLDENWARFSAAKAKYGRKFGFRDPGRIGAVLISSECDELTVDDIIAEFHIERLDDYFERCRRDRADRL